MRRFDLQVQLIILISTEFVRESRRANAQLRIGKNDDRPSPPLATIHMTDGTVSRHYPKDLECLFKLDGKSFKNSYSKHVF